MEQAIQSFVSIELTYTHTVHVSSMFVSHRFIWHLRLEKQQLYIYIDTTILN